MTDVAAICAALSPAQRKALTSGGSVIPSMGPFGHDTVVLGSEYARSAGPLYRLGLTQFAWVPCLLTELGMSVRSALMKDKAL